jgi:hypothetical protein
MVFFQPSDDTDMSEAQGSPAFQNQADALALLWR